MNMDMCVSCDDGIINIRAGAIILKDNKVLMVGNHRDDYLYSVGGRLKFGETAEDAVIREVFEETGVRMEVDRHGFIHQNYFRSGVPGKEGRVVYEISYYFYMKVPSDFSPECMGYTEDNCKEFLVWVDPSEQRKIFPEFFRKELLCPKNEVQYFTTDDR